MSLLNSIKKALNTTKEISTPTVTVTSSKGIDNDTVRNILFNTVYDSLLSIPFDEKWANGTGYFDYLKSADLELRDGEMVSSYDYHSNRKIIIISSNEGNLSIFERYTEGEGGVFVCHITDIFKHGPLNGALSLRSISGFLGLGTINIVERYRIDISFRDRIHAADGFGTFWEL